MAILVILIQYLTPLQTVAETVVNATDESGGISFSSINVNKNENSVTIDLKGNYIFQTNVSSNSYEVSASENVTLDANQVVTVVNSNGEQIGKATVVNEHTLKIEELPTASAAISFSVTATLTEVTGVENNQMISFTDSYGKKVTQELTLNDAMSPTSTTTESESGVESSNSGSDSSTSATSSSTSAKAASRAESDEPIDISTLFPTTDGRTSMVTAFEIQDENGNPIESMKVDDYIEFYFGFDLPEEVRAQMKGGDYYEFDLPKEFTFSQNKTIPLTDENGITYANVEVDVNGHVKIVFTDDVQNASNISGSFEAGGKAVETEIPAPGPIDVDTPFVDGDPGTSIIIKPDVDTTISKEGHFNRTPNPSEVIWNVDVNKAMDTVDGATVTEHFPDGLTYESVKVYKVDVDFDGNVIDGSETEVPASEYTVDSTGNITFTNSISSAYRVEYTTSIDDDVKPGDEGGTVNFKNTADFGGDDTATIPAEASVVADYKPALVKGQPNYNATDQTFDWTINYNFNEKNIKQTQASITDSIGSGMVLENDSVKLYKVTFDDKGNPVESGTPLVEGTDYELTPKSDGSGFDVKFLTDVDYAVNVHYTTQVTDEIDSDTDFTNSVEDGSGNQDSESGHAKQQGLVKEKGDVDYTNKQVEWKIAVNKNNYSMENWKLTDTFSEGLTLLTDQFTITDTTTNTALQEGTDYTLEYNADTQTFNVEFIGSYVETSDSFLIDYWTGYDAAYLSTDMPQFSNDASADWTSTTDNTKKNPSSDADFKPNPAASANGFKSGDYNAVSKLITWTLGTNFENDPLENETITDPITDNQKYVPDSLKIYQYTVDQDGNHIKGAEITGTEKTAFEVNEPSESNNQTLTINLPDSAEDATNNRYMFEYQTSLVGEVIHEQGSYENHANVTGDSHVDYTIKGQVSIENGGSYAQKEGVQDDDGYVDWSVTVNPSQSTINNVVVKDNPSTNQVIDPASIAVYATTVDTAGKITKGELVSPNFYTAEVTTDNETGEQHLTVTFNEQLETAYILEYKSMVFLDEGTTSGSVSNDLTIKGDNVETIDGEDSADVDIHTSDGDGTAVGTLGKVTLQKTDEAGQALTGATFELWDAKNQQVLRSGTIDASGDITFGSIPYGSYLLKETKAPDGYTIPDDLVAGRKVTISAETSTADVPINVEDAETQVVLTKESEDGTKLVGAEFSLEAEMGETWTPIRTGEAFITDSNGQIAILGLTPGHYRLTETKAPTTPIEYIQNTEPIEFDVVQNENGQIPSVEVGPYVNYLGSAEFTKTDTDGNPLSGAIFEVKRVKDAQGNSVNETVNTTATSDENGKVALTGLAPGSYEVTETQAPDGYLINTEKITFEIANSAAAQPATVAAGTLIDYQGSIELQKTDSTGTGLAGAVFQLEDSEGNVVKTDITSGENGEITVDGLAPGSYNLVETQAPTGYIINTDPIPFTIDASANGVPTTKQLDNFINYQGSVKLHKVNSSNEGLAGAEFTLYDNGGNALGIYTSNGAGMVEIENLAPGNYSLTETKAPLQENGQSYIINSYPVNFTISESSAGEVPIKDLGDFQNFRGKLRLLKADGETGNFLAGASFDLYKASGVISEGTAEEELVASDIESDANGEVNYGELEVGTYKLVETEAPDGYTINQNPIYFVIEAENADVTDTFEFDNYKTPIEFSKVDSDGNPLAGAQFKIVQTADDTGTFATPETIVENLTSGSDGKVTYDGLAQGTYQIIETQAPTGYILNTEPVTFEIDAAQGEPETKVLDDLVNEQGSIQFTKVDSNGKGLAGAEFTLYEKERTTPVKDKNGKEITGISAKDGTVKLSNLAPGDYQLLETKAPTGYIKNTTPINFTISATVAGTVTPLELADYANYQGSVELTKVDKADKTTVLQGAEFTLYNSQGKALKQKLTTNRSGKITVSQLAPGSYYFVETQAPTSYQLNPQKYKFTIKDSEIGAPDKVTLIAENGKVPTTSNKSQTGSGGSQGNTQDGLPATNERDTSKWLFLLGIGLIGLSSGLIYHLRKKQLD